MKEKIPLERVKAGESATVYKINTNAALGVRLRDLGFVKGAKVSLLYEGHGIKAYGICGTVIALRDSDAACVEVIYG